MIPEAQHAVATTFQEACTVRIDRFLMLGAVNFDDHCGFDTQKVDDERADGLLPSELRSETPVAQVEPQQAFGVGGFAAEVARELKLGGGALHAPDSRGSGCSVAVRVCG
ncbi:hypothetical protein LUTEI9C_110006 [Luteimonas sp. 9C]|nr:hypothetical protein LUTEI9C_110006 [Luteimonas sp. 9C]